MTRWPKLRRKRTRSPARNSLFLGLGRTGPSVDRNYLTIIARHSAEALDCHPDSCFDGSVPADDQVTSLDWVDRSGHNGRIAFTTTHWSVVLEAQGESPAAQEALEVLCRTYWRPVYGFVRRQGIRPEEAEDLTQGFFALLLERRDLDAVRKEKGRLRSYLLTALKHFLASEQRRAMALKRGKGQQLVPLEGLARSNEGRWNQRILSAPTVFMNAAGR